MKKICATVAAVMLMMGSAAAETEAIINVEDGSWLNMREAPRSDAYVYCRLERGDAVKILGVDEGWAEVNRAGDLLYCRIEYLLDANSQAVEITARSTVNVRKLPSKKSMAMSKVKKGHTVQAIGTITVDDVTWYKLEDGYAMTEYFE